MSYSDDRTSGNTAALEDLAAAIRSKEANDKLKGSSKNEGYGLIDLLADLAEGIAALILLASGAVSSDELKKSAQSYQYTNRKPS
jgi:energy-converting hydrogenase Eha subunit H